MIIDYSSSFNLQGKRYDWVKIAYILKELNRPMTANQINYCFNRIFKNSWCNSQRVAQLMKSRGQYFGMIDQDKKRVRRTRTYYWKGGNIILNKTTKLNWQNKIKTISDHY